MRIYICCGLDFIKEIKESADALRERRFEVTIPMTAEKVINGEITAEDVANENMTGEISNRITNGCSGWGTLKNRLSLRAL